ncbi:uncharacterized protein MONOS_4246 [Monocercomonoides exilis]|uniref:uncharacterized protein n=1 Tax=Monocercomonoides exilis TaxID=2049356 RepID=UPI003559A061|nr:hypothetical protein MONOS_4246 [Monocercomonoides exilis]|eukprot:MONOS_4246.1-p1 / transcript=MONOS_4246.1 / gene=MONOS_4246 / organism=Monocercomonoides_exilis_PA203 / gene_product=unspecified product / transcript_product=unspecified product / location=Mono_scaffold00110:96813-97777(+) / protein_length=302 / sequence_SO=supercontig / SO=protein_coding / is_pseudo=false
MALLALSRFGYWKKEEQECFISEIKEIIQCHQEHGNLTRLAYHSAWQFLIYRLFFKAALNRTIVNELDFVGEATRELEELTRRANWKRKEERNKGKEMKEEHILMRWIQILELFFEEFELWDTEIVGLIRSIVHAYRAAKDNYMNISDHCIRVFVRMASHKAVKVEYLIENGAADTVVKSIHQTEIDDRKIFECLNFLMNVSYQLKGKEDDEMEEEEEEEEFVGEDEERDEEKDEEKDEMSKDKMEEAKRKELKRKVLEKMEEEGFEDFIISIRNQLDFLKVKFYYCGELSLNMSDYFVDV